MHPAWAHGRPLAWPRARSCGASGYLSGRADAQLLAFLLIALFSLWLARLPSLGRSTVGHLVLRALHP